MKLESQIAAVHQEYHYRFIAEPIRSVTGELRGTELLTRFYGHDEAPLDSQHTIATMRIENKRQMFCEQLDVLEHYANWFRHQRCFCSLNIDTDIATILQFDRQLSIRLQALEFVTLEISETFTLLNQGLKNPLLRQLSLGVNPLWLDDMGSGDATMVSVMEGCYDVVKMDKQFFWHHADRPIFVSTVQAIQQFCPRIVVEGVDNARYLPLLARCGIWGVQGYLFPSMSMSMLTTLC